MDKLAGVLVTLLLAGCVVPSTIEETVLPARIDYACPGNLMLPVLRAENGAAAAVLINGQQIVMQRMPSAAQEKYSSGGYSLYLEGERAMLEIDGRVIGPCGATMPLPVAPRTTL